ncbi:MAG: hypothetical protein D6763_07685 [Alphaproteobacteria bacterium]|nr:MAG: hypothetical protein D6763_07685 [Alphaproteobacteria bacterium]
MTWHGFVRLSVVTLAMIALSACGPLVELPGGGDPASLYTLSPARPIALATAFPDATLMIEEPETSAAYDSKGIALMPEARELRYYAGAKWVDRAPRMFQTLLITAFEESGAFRDVGPPSMTLAADYRLHTALRAFNADYQESAAPTVRVTIHAKLFGARPLNLLGSTRIDVEEPAGSDRMTDIVAAFDRAAQRAMTDIITWTVSTLETPRDHQTTAP